MDSTTITIQVLLFAKAKEALGNKTSIPVKLLKSKSTTLQLIDELKTQYPEISQILDTSLLAVNHEYVERGRDIQVNENDEVSIIPPISSG